jgi:hypothetical protein
VARLEVYAPKRMLREAEELARAAGLLLGAEAEVYALPDDFAYRLELARAYAPDRYAQLLERGVHAAPAVVLAGAPPRPLFLGRLPSLAELAAALRLPAAPPVEVEEVLVEPARWEPPPAEAAPQPQRFEGAAPTAVGTAQTTAAAPETQPEPQLVVETRDAVREAAAEEEGRPRRGRGRRRRR